MVIVYKHNQSFICFFLCCVWFRRFIKLYTYIWGNFYFFWIIQTYTERPNPKILFYKTKFREFPEISRTGKFFQLRSNWKNSIYIWLQIGYKIGPKSYNLETKVTNSGFCAFEAVFSPCTAILFSGEFRIYLPKEKPLRTQIKRLK